ncbi:MAG: hypothetical protein IKA87_08075 [Lentisphaeria bacterium]|nr:hypothetical protein [Lentisphaeria bacterium]
MGKIFFKTLFLLLIFSGTFLHAQIGMGIQVNRRSFIQYEPVFVRVTLRNDTGRALLFGKSPKLQGFLMFDIRSSGNKPVQKRKNKEISIDGLILGPGETRSVIIPINEYYNIDHLGTYEIHAYVAHSMLKKEFKSPNTFFRVEYGATIWKKTVGVPDIYDKVKSQSEERTYEIRSMAEGRRRHYYLVVSDEKNVYGVVRIGHQMGYEKLQVEVDMLSRIHLLVPVSPRVFHYLSFSLDGANISNSFWKTGTTIPQLYRNPKTGVVTRIGGIEAKAGRDFINPEYKKISGSKLLRDEDLDNASIRNVPRPAKSQPMFDLGKGLEKTVKSNILNED